MPSAKLIQKLKPALQNPLPPEQDGILLCLDSANVTGDNAKYMNMYNRLARWYDFGERWIARLRYGNSINETRRSLMDELEWRQDCTALYVSIGTGTDLNHLPADINLSALDLTGADLSLGMLARCRDVWREKAAGLDLVHCNAEDLPFADNIFDVVFHVGGINFFSDKQKAINEMLRVAKPGTKIMIADETTDFIQQQYKKSIFTWNYFQDTDFDLTQIENCIPKTVQEKKTRLLWNNRFYCITFRKPA
ncbi:SAM-dependent methyltransferase [Neisseria sp. HMSC055H02]|nr:SAM-dependent methyltransferase [Neisseria sp. HMSC055H02]